MVEEFKLQQKIRKKFSLKKIKFGDDYEFIPLIFKSKKNWDADKYNDFISDNKIVILTLQKAMLQKKKSTMKIYTKMLDQALERQEFALIANEYYPIINLIIESISLKNSDKFLQAIAMIKDIHQKCITLDSKNAQKITKEIEKKLAVAQKEYARIFT
ncbi:MAG: hypothetical protein EU516_01305 [Promethearchaeota archaeon]|nr:MAG: hypothetical protein EU516_01305 [Candidatus Lokiarchaeota archaeon]